jgi:formylglycine-generating enzyme required for sulfatase activity
MVSWNDAEAFTRWLSRKEGVKYRLPTEAEWEYACRAGTTTRYWTGDDPETLAVGANVPDATYREAEAANGEDIGYAVLTRRDGFANWAPVGNYRPNPFGLYDMHGNVWEWCVDGYHKDMYARNITDDPIGPPTDLRVIRGGCYM